MDNITLTLETEHELYNNIKRELEEAAELDPMGDSFFRKAIRDITSEHMFYTDEMEYSKGIRVLLDYWDVYEPIVNEAHRRHYQKKVSEQLI